MITVDCRTKKQKRQEFIERIKMKFDDGKDWVINNKETVVFLTPAILGGVATVIKVAGKHANLRKEEQTKLNYCYDRSLGHYWKLRRPLSNDEWISLEKRKANGERMGDILADMKVLK